MNRYGNFSSSNIWKLTKLARNKSDFGQVALTYIEETRYEQRLGRRLTPETKSYPTDWGTFMESYCFEKIGKIDKGTFWELVSNDRLVHPEINNWTGIPDLLTKDNKLGFNDVGDIKNPWTLKSFCKLCECTTGEDLKNQNGSQDDGHKYYWQLVSNAILTGRNTATLFVHVPYRGELSNIRKRALEDGELDWLSYKDDSELPYLILGEGYNDLHEINFDVDENDVDFLTEQVKKAVKLL